MKKWNDRLSTIYIDIDDTITKDMGKTFIEGALEKIKKFSIIVNIYLWSQGGLEYVIKIATTGDLNDYICGCLPKPDLIVDDLDFNVFCGQMEPDWNRFSEIMQTLDGDNIDDVEKLRIQKKK